MATTIPVKVVSAVPAVVTVPGNFNLPKLSPSYQEILTDAYETITRLGLWEKMKEDPGSGGFMYSGHNYISEISSAIKYDGHSGASFGWTMRVMQFIAKNGWDAYVTSIA